MDYSQAQVLSILPLSLNSKAVDDVVSNDDLISFIFINWVDPMCCLPILLTCKRFHGIYRVRVSNRIQSSIRLFCSFVPLLAWGVNMGMPTLQLCDMCAASGNLDGLRWLRSQMPPIEWNEDTCAAAARGGHLGVLMWMRRQSPPCPWDEFTLSGAVSIGSITILKWLRSQQPPCPWSEWSVTQAIDLKQHEALNWLLEQDPPCPMDDFSKFCIVKLVHGWETKD